VLGLDFDRRGRLYVLETGEAGGFPAPGAGRVIRLDRKGNRVVIVEGLFLPAGLRIGPDGWLYISNKGFGPPQPGEILRVDIRGTDNGGADESDDMESGDN
jgi:sugar lactone lactonase YvrE